MSWLKKVFSSQSSQETKSVLWEKKERKTRSRTGKRSKNGKFANWW